MRHTDWTINKKPYDLRERLFLFACVIVRLVQFLHAQGGIPKALSYQLLDSGMSSAANYEEADDGSSPRDKLAKRKLVLRELKETSLRLRVLRATGYLTDAHDPVLGETSELIKIVATLIRNTAKAPPV